MKENWKRQIFKNIIFEKKYVVPAYTIHTVLQQQ